MSYVITFFQTSILFGLVMGFINQSIFTGIFSGLQFGALITLSIFIINKVKGEKGPVKKVTQEKQIELNLPFEDSYDKCLSSLTTLKAKLKSENRESGEITAKTGISLRSAGEVIKITVSSKSDSASSITLFSKPFIPMTLVDYGKNYENIQSLKDYLLK